MSEPLAEPEDPLPNPPPDYRERGPDRRTWALLAVLLFAGFVGHVLYLTLSPPIGLAGDEAHYWDWSRRLDWSYYSKGPAVAVLIRGGRLLFGDTLLGVRFPALVLAVGTSLCTFWLTRRVFGSARLALGAVALTHCCPLFVAGSLLMTIDAPFYFCWAVATCLGYLAIIENRRGAWPLVGVFLGLGFLAKYAALLWLVGMLIYLLLARRDLLKTPWPWLATLIAFAFTTPVLWWNHRHDWVSFGHVARSTSENQNGFNPLKIAAQFGELIGGQVGLLNPIVFAFMAGGIWRAFRRERSERLLSKRSRDATFSRDATPPRRPHWGRVQRAKNPAPQGPAWETPDADRIPDERSSPARPTPGALLYLLAVGLPFFGFVALVTLFKNTEPNWPAPAYFTLVPLAAWFVAVTWPKTKGWLVGAVAIGVVAIGMLHESAPLYRLVPWPPRKWDPSARLVGWADVGRAVSAELKMLRPGAIVIADKYQLAGLMAFYVDDHPKTFCLGSYIADAKERDRLTQYDMWPDRDLSQPALRGRDAVFVGHAPPDLFGAFDSVERLSELPITRGGVLIRRQSIYRCHGFRGLTRPTDGLTKR